MILATERHVLPDAGSPGFLSDCALFLDMDLSILGAPPLLQRYFHALLEVPARRNLAQSPTALAPFS